MLKRSHVIIDIGKYVRQACTYIYQIIAVYRQHSVQRIPPPRYIEIGSVVNAPQMCYLFISYIIVHMVGLQQG